MMPTYLLIRRGKLPDEDRFHAMARGKRLMRIRLTVLPALWHAGREHIILPTGKFFGQADYRMLRRVAGGWIATDEPGRVRRLLGLPEDDSGIRPLVYLPDWRDDD
jgi:hypothetical protein